jgi:glycerol-3-phosphate acyltransferase PlsY
VGEHVLIAALLVLAFLLGTVPTGLWLVRCVRGTDVRDVGSGNIGATNVVRAAGWFWGIVTLVIDALKGAAVPLAMAWLDTAAGAPLLRWQIAAGALTLAGNAFNPFLGFRGGKGVGTAIGIVAVVAAGPFGYALIAFAVSLAATRIVSVGSLIAALVFVATAVAGFVFRSPRPPWEWLGFCMLLGLMVFWTHRSNLKRIIQGTETRLTRRE